MKEKKWYGFDGFKHEIQEIEVSMQIVTCVNGTKCLLFADYRLLFGFRH